MSGNSFDRIVIDLPPGDEASAEVVFGREVGDGQYEIRNVPIWAYGIAYEDIVEARPAADDPRIHFVRVIEKSGLLTVRAAGPEADPAAFAKVVELLRRRAVVTEEYSNTYCAFAMERNSFAGIEAEIDRAEHSDAIFVEVSNDVAD